MRRAAPMARKREVGEEGLLGVLPGRVSPTPIATQGCFGAPSHEKVRRIPPKAGHSVQ